MKPADPDVTKADRSPFAVVLDAEVARKLPFLVQLRDQLPIEVGPDQRPLRHDPEMVPVLFLEQSLHPFLVIPVLHPARIEPASQPDSVNPGRFLQVNLALVAPGLALIPRTAIGKSGIEVHLARILGQEHLQLRLEVPHRNFSGHPAIRPGVKFEHPVPCFEAHNFATRCPPLRALPVKEIHPLRRTSRHDHKQQQF